MERAEFQKLVAEGFDRLPERVRRRIDNVALLIEDEPSADVRLREGLGESETLLGYYQGVPLSARGDLYGVGMTMPDTITIYQEPILDLADEECPPGAPDAEYREHVRRIVTETVWHEYAHHFGMDEGEVRAREAQRDSGRRP